MQDQEMQHADGRTAVAATPTERVTLRAQGFVDAKPADELPSTDWTHERLDQYATAHNVDLTGAKSKADKLAAIEAPPVAVDNA